MPLGDLLTSRLPFLTARGPAAYHLPQVPPLLVLQLSPIDPCVLLSLGCRGTAPHRDISLTLGLAHRPSLVVSGNSSCKSHGRKRQQVKKVARKYTSGKSIEVGERKKKDTQTPSIFRQFESRASALHSMKIKEEKQPVRENPQPELASSLLSTWQRAAGKSLQVTGLDF